MLAIFGHLFDPVTLLAMLAGIVVLTRIDWRKRLGGGDTPGR